MIRTQVIDLYEYYEIDPQGAEGGRLSCWSWRTPEQFSPGGRRRPAVLVLPGGGYQHVSCREGEPVAMQFLAGGYCAFSLDYSVDPSRFPVALREAAMAMRYIREHARELEVDPGMVAAIGFSAGGHLCGTLGTLYDCPEVADIAPAEVLRPDALGLCYPVAVSWGNTHEGSFDSLTGTDAALRARLSLDRCVRRDMPPVYLWHTADDETVPVRNSLLMALALDEAEVPFALHVYRHGAHGLSLANAQVFPTGQVRSRSEDVTEWPGKMMNFFAELGFAMTDE